MTTLTSKNRLIKGDGYVLVMEEVADTVILHDMFQQISSLIAGAEETADQLDDALSHLAGIQFVVVHYYSDFVSPSNFQGYALVMLTVVPDHVNDVIREIIKEAPDDDLGRIFLLATRHDDTQQKFKVLRNESQRVVQTRIKTLRAL